ncbi:MAG: hypothetical protein HOD92_05625 [Deltaproteobacteria bacterium]|jgi:hypothetical protein|nr:hypothetical protein [Deltaproteobacteria bacterium]MBT4525633.1 hypothetical protein [Deltaproteobacteria bacterium]
MNFKPEKNENKKEFDFKIPDYLKHHPFVVYLKIYQNQHKVIHTLYQGLIFSFSGFLILISFLIYNALDSSFVPWWGVVMLGVIDACLFFGVIKAVVELKQYRIKSQEVLFQMLNFIQNDTNGKLLVTKGSHLTSKTKKRISPKIKLLTGRKASIPSEPYKGWDVQYCSQCKASFEMSKEECPFCHHKLGSPQVH